MAHSILTRPTTRRPPTVLSRPLFVLAFILAAVIIPAVNVSAAPAASRGIAVTAVTADGQTLNLYKNSYALLVGVSRYAPGGWPALEQVPGEMARVEAALKKQGFTVTTRIDPDGTDLKKAFEDFINQYGYNPDNRLLFYYAGHGYTLKDGDNGYLVPKDAPDPRRDETGFKRKALDMNLILAWCRSMDAKHALFLFDSCFSGAIFKQRDLPAAPPAVSRMTAEPVRQFITAGGAGETVPARSTFTPAFVDALDHGLGDMNKDGYISGTELGLYLADKVPRHVSQTPQYGKISDYNLSRGDFIFVAGGSTLVSTPASEATTSSKALLTVEANVSGAAVYLDNRGIGAAPVRDMEIAPGSHTVRVENSGYETYQITRTFEAGRKASLTAYLEAKAPPKARLYVDVQPSAATVRVVNAGSFSQGMELEPGGYQVEAAADGYEPLSQRVNLAAGEDKTISFRLKEKAATPAAVSGGASVANDLGMEFVYIQPGTFMMGSPSSESGRDNDETQHRVTLTQGFYMQTTEVTQGQWQAIMGGNPSFFKNCGDNCPVEQVSWDDVQEFIRRLNQRTGKNYRLPTEAEWEYACRAGSSSRFCFGDSDSSLGSYAWYTENSGRSTHPVARKNSNVWGLYDMHGNVWEWCQDWYGDYPSGSVTDPTGPSSGSYRVHRGGGWYDGPQNCRSALRVRRTPDCRISILGFRLARTN